MEVHEVMTWSVISVPAEASVLEAGELMVRHDISGLPVVDANGHLVGMVTERDFLRPDGITVDTPRPRWFEVLAGRSNPPVCPRGTSNPMVHSQPGVPAGPASKLEDAARRRRGGADQAAHITRLRRVILVAVKQVIAERVSGKVARRGH